MKYPRSNARAFFHHERCPSCGSSLIDWRSAERRCGSCGMSTAPGIAGPAPTPSLDLQVRGGPFQAGRDGLFHEGSD